jgi:hypothetical protein
MLNQMCAPRHRNKIWCAVICVLCLVFGIYLLPFISAIIQIGTNVALTAKELAD